MSGQEKLAVAACHDEVVAKAAKAAGFRDIFYSKKCDTTGLTKTVLEAVEFAKSSNRLHQKWLSQSVSLTCSDITLLSSITT